MLLERIKNLIVGSYRSTYEPNLVIRFKLVTTKIIQIDLLNFLIKIILILIYLT